MRGREKEHFPGTRVNNKSTNSAERKKKKKKKKNPQIAQVNEPAWYVRTQVGVTAGADMMFNDQK